MVTAIDLFSGIGGIKEALREAGFKILCYAESDEFCQKVIRKHDPKAIIFNDVRDITTETFPQGIGCDIIAGGFPCQPFSNAGLMLGSDDSRDLSHEFLRIVGIFRPRSVFVENVSGFTLFRGLDTIRILAQMGYELWWGIVPASDVGAPHQRERFLCAGTLGDTNEDGLQAVGKMGLGGDDKKGNTSLLQRQATRTARSVYVSSDATNWTTHKSAYRFSRKHDGVLSWLHQHQFPPRPDEMDFSQMESFGDEEGTTDEIKALGNSAVPQAIYPIVKAIFDRLSKGV